MKTKHTQGEWSLATSGEMIYVIASDQFDGFTGKIVADLTIGEGDNSKDITEANAKLIAAAPDLLRALGNLRDAINNNLDSYGGEIAGASQKAKQAIKKATE